MKNYALSYWKFSPWNRQINSNISRLVFMIGVVLVTLITLDSSAYSQEKCMKNEDTVFAGEKLLAGGWAIHKTVDKEAKTTLAKAVAAQKSKVKYEPVAFASQVVAGMNYCYLCIALPQKSNELPFFCSVSFYQDLKGNYKDFKVKKIEFKDYK